MAGSIALMTVTLGMTLGQSTPPQLPTARTILDAYAKAVNLNERVKKTQSVHTRGRFIFAGGEGLVEYWAAKPSNIKYITHLPSFGAVTQCANGEVVWEESNQGARLLQGIERHQFMLEAPYDYELRSSPEIQSTTEGKEEFNGVECFKLRFSVQPRPGKEGEAETPPYVFFEYYDCKTSLLVGRAGIKVDSLSQQEYTTNIGEYRDFNGYRLATRFVMQMAGQSYISTVDSVVYDETEGDVGKDVFAMPKQVENLLKPPKKEGAR